MQFTPDNEVYNEFEANLIDDMLECMMVGENGNQIWAGKATPAYLDFVKALARNGMLSFVDEYNVISHFNLLYKERHPNDTASRTPRLLLHILRFCYN